MNGLDLIYEPVRAGLLRVDELIAASCPIRPIGPIRMLAGGKRLRPALVLFSAQASSNPKGQIPNPKSRIENPKSKSQNPYDVACRVGAALEMVHAASLIHDDVIDSATRRRAGASLHRVIGIKPAVVFADLLFVEGLGLLDRVRPADIVVEVIAAVRTMCRGQWLEMETQRSGECTLGRYRQIIDEKTAALFACCCRAGARLRRAQSTEIELYEGFGRSFGRAYQYFDDAGDFTGNPEDAIERSVARRGGAPFCRKLGRHSLLEAAKFASRLPCAETRASFEKLLVWLEEG